MAFKLKESIKPDESKVFRLSGGITVSIENNGGRRRIVEVNII